jgi:hypothetical protein
MSQWSAGRPRPATLLPSARALPNDGRDARRSISGSGPAGAVQ